MNEEPLSESGKHRRQEILSLAKAEATRRRRRQSNARGAGAMVTIGLVFIAVVLVRPRQPVSPRPMPIAVIPPASQPVVAIQYLQTDVGISDRLAIKPQPPRWTAISDHELLDELAAAGQPAGIVCINGKTRLLPR